MAVNWDAAVAALMQVFFNATNANPQVPSHIQSLSAALRNMANARKSWGDVKQVKGSAASTPASVPTPLLAVSPIEKLGPFRGFPNTPLLELFARPPHLSSVFAGDIFDQCPNFCFLNWLFVILLMSKEVSLWTDHDVVQGSSFGAGAFCKRFAALQLPSGLELFPTLPRINGKCPCPCCIAAHIASNGVVSLLHSYLLDQGLVRISLSHQGGVGSRSEDDLYRLKRVSPSGQGSSAAAASGCGLSQSLSMQDPGSPFELFTRWVSGGGEGGSTFSTFSSSLAAATQIDTRFTCPSESLCNAAGTLRIPKGEESGKNSERVELALYHIHPLASPVAMGSVCPVKENVTTTCSQCKKPLTLS